MVPVLKYGDTLVATIVAALSDEDLERLRAEVIDKVGRFRARGVVIDVTALDVLDSFATRTIRGIASTAQLRGADTVVVGIQPDVAVAMVQLGLALDDIETALDMEDGMALLEARRRSRRVG